MVFDKSNMECLKNVSKTPRKFGQEVLNLRGKGQSSCDTRTICNHYRQIESINMQIPIILLSYSISPLLAIIVCIYRCYTSFFLSCRMLQSGIQKIEICKFIYLGQRTFHILPRIILAAPFLTIYTVRQIVLCAAVF